MKYVLFAGALLLLALLVIFKSQRPDKSPLRPGEAILAFGDSITYGYGVAPQESYPALLAEMSGMRVINAGVNGEISQEGVERLPGLLEDASVRLLLLCSGGNDILRRRSKGALKANLKQMIAMAKAKGVEVVLIGVPTFGMLGLKSLPLYEEVAGEEGVVYIDGLLPGILNDAALKNDYVHPNAAGYRRLAEGIFSELQKQGWIVQ